MSFLTPVHSVKGNNYLCVCVEAIVEPLNKGHDIGIMYTVLCREVVLILEVEYTIGL